MKQVFFHSWKKYLFSVIYIIFITVLYLAINNVWQFFLAYIDGLFIAGFSLFCIGLLALMNNLGAFDIFGYVFSKKTPERRNLYDYSEFKKEERKRNKYSFVPFVAVAAITIIISIILYLILNLLILS